MALWKFIVKSRTFVNQLFRSTCTTLMSVGLILLMFAVDINWFIFPGIVFFTSGSFALLVTNYALSQLFPRATGVIMALGIRLLHDVKWHNLNHLKWKASLIRTVRFPDIEYNLSSLVNSVWKWCWIQGSSLFSDCQTVSLKILKLNLYRW